MVEDVDLTREILEFFASDEVSFPANVTIDELQRRFPSENTSRLQYHVLCAQENDLLRADEPKRIETFAEGVTYHIGRIDGLTSKGREYVKHSRTKFWNQAKKICTEQGLKVTTERLLDFLL